MKRLIDSSDISHKIVTRQFDKLKGLYTSQNKILNFPEKTILTQN